MWTNKGQARSSHAIGMRGGAHVRGEEERRGMTGGVTREKKRIPLRWRAGCGEKERWAKGRRIGPAARGFSL